ncbi:MAG: hypothetical protein AAGG75_23140 [Bacteroidota bacterium]
MKSNILLMLSIFVLMCVGCTKGDMGPQGPQGIQGPQGPQGPQGVAGNADVRRYQTSIALSDFARWPSTNEWWEYYYPPITISDRDVVLAFVYENHAGDNEWIALPMIDHWYTGNCFNAFNYSVNYSNNRIQFTIRNSCGSSPYTNMNSGALSYRVFIIKGTAKEKLDSIKDLTNYYEVAQALGFEE